jgi:hypothetical protein
VFFDRKNTTTTLQSNSEDLMALGHSIQLRLSAERRLLYETEAANRNLPLGTYLRERLENGDALLEEISALRQAISMAIKNTSAAQSNHAAPTPSTNLSIQIETLLLLRSLNNPQKLQIIHGELKRLGLKVWDGDPQSDSEAFSNKSPQEITS